MDDTQGLHSGDNGFYQHDMDAPAPTGSSRRRIFLRRLIIALCISALLAVAASALIARALPGDALYFAKLDLLEPAVGSFRFTGVSRARYQVSLLERRLEEMRTLQSENGLSSERFMTLFRELEGGLSTVTDMDQYEAVSAQDWVLMTSETVSIFRTAEIIAEAHDDLPPDAQKTEALRREAASAYTEAVKEFVQSTGKEDVQSFIAAQLSVVESKIRSSGLPPERLATIEKDVQNVARATGRDDLSGAVRAAMQALQRIRTAEYLKDVSLGG